MRLPNTRGLLPRALAAVAGLALAAVLPALSGCAQSADAAQPLAIQVDGGSIELDAAAPVNTVLVQASGVNAGTEPSGSLPTGAVDALEATLATDGLLDIVTVEGEPQSFGMQSLGSQEGDAGIRAEENEQTVAQLAQGIAAGGIAATTEEADVYGAVALAGRELASAAGEDSTEVMVVSCSMVATAGTVNFADGGMTLASSPEDVLAWLEGAGELVDLSAVDHLLVYYTGRVAGDQPALSNADLTNLEALWTAVLADGCGCPDVRFLGETPTESGLDVSGLPPVTPVEVTDAGPYTAPDPEPGTVISLGVAERVSFAPDEAVFLDEEAARATLSALAEKLADAGATVALEGNTAGDDTPAAHDRLVDLSLRRAQAVADVLVEEGLPAERIVSVTGNGSAGGAYSEHVKDTDEAGVQIPELAQQNRTVVVAVTNG